MLTVTEAARVRLTDMLADHPAEIAARIVLEDEQMKLRQGTKRSGDQAFKHQGRIVLLLGKTIVSRLQDRVLDVRTTIHGPKLGLRPAPVE